MIIDGKKIADLIREDQKKRVSLLRTKKIIPHVTVLLVGNDSSSQVYIRQKQRYGESIGVSVSVNHFNPDSNPKTFLSRVSSLNTDPHVHGIIIQRPIPLSFSKKVLNSVVIPIKDVDGFHPKSPYEAPISLAILKIFAYIGVYFRTKKILVIGRGESGGGPIAQTLAKMHIPYTVAHSKTENREQLCRDSDIIISCVGKANIVRREMVSNRTILLGVGLHAENGKLKSDYNEEEIKDVVKYYTPVPGGVGPVNVACLFENVLKAALYYKSKAQMTNVKSNPKSQFQRHF